MGRISKAQKSRQEKAKKGGRGRKKTVIPDTSIKTPWRPRTTLWRLKRYAANAQKTLFATAFQRLVIDRNTRPFSPLLYSLSNSTMPSTGNRSTRAVAGSELGANTPAEIPGVDVVREGGKYQHLNIKSNPEELEFRLEEGDFEDIEDGVEALYIEEYGKMELEEAVSNWPNVQSVPVRCMILNQGNSDISNINDFCAGF